MLFARREKPKLAERVRVAFWPRASWGRSARYFSKRVVRLSASPHAIAAGVAAGVIVSWTPFVGFHFVMSAAIALALGGNLIASAIGTAIGNPLTFPFMWWSSYELGRTLTGGHLRGEKFGQIIHGIGKAPFSEILPILKPMLVGALPLGVVSGTITYLIVRFAVNAYQTARRERLSERRAGRESAASEAENEVPTA